MKAVVIKTGQLRHVLDERKYLAQMNNDFVLKYHGAYQTTDELIMVTAALEGTDLWTRTYETPPYEKRRGAMSFRCSRCLLHASILLFL